MQLHRSVADVNAIFSLNKKKKKNSPQGQRQTIVTMLGTSGDFASQQGASFRNLLLKTVYISLLTFCGLVEAHISGKTPTTKT